MQYFVCIFALENRLTIVHMKRNLSFWAITVATFILVVLTVIPHHHHNGAVCMAMERCALDGALNDEHTRHHGTQEKDCCFETMTSASTATSENTVEQSKQQLFPLFIASFYQLADLWDSLNPDARNNYAYYKEHYTSASLGKKRGLRAPPCLSFMA